MDPQRPGSHPLVPSLLLPRTPDQHSPSYMLDSSGVSPRPDGISPRLTDLSPAKSIFLQNYRQQQAFFRDEGAQRSSIDEAEAAERRELLQRMITGLLSQAQSAAPDRHAQSSGSGSSVSPGNHVYRLPSPVAHLVDTPRTPSYERSGEDVMPITPRSFVAPVVPPLELPAVQVMAPPSVLSYSPHISSTTVNTPSLGPPIVHKLERVKWRGPLKNIRDVQLEEIDERRLVEAREGQRRRMLEDTIRCQFQLAMYDIMEGDSPTCATARDSGPGEVDPSRLYNMVERKDVEVLGQQGGVRGIATGFETNLENGLTLSQVQAHREKYGKNELPPQEQQTFWEYVKDALGDKMMRALIFAALLSLILGLTVPDPETGKVDYATGWVEGAAILLSVTVVTLVSATNDYQKAKKFAQLSDENSRKEVCVIRGGTKHRIDSTELVVGDVLEVEGGDILAADGVLIEGQDLKCDESTATGEADAITKDEARDPFLISGTSVMEGRGHVLITGVGPNSFSGKHTLLTREGGESKTPLQERLEELADQIGVLGMGAAGATFAALAIKELFAIFQGTHPLQLKPFLDFTIVAVTIVVVAIPEGLPLAVTISLAYSMRNMMKDNCLVRVLAACETMGGANTICSDKTGTLTTNKMTVVQGWVGDKVFKDARAYDFKSLLNHSVLHLLSEAICMNSTADQKPGDDGQMVWVGNKTEFALLQFVKDQLGMDFKGIRSMAGKGDVNIYAFNSEKKRMTTIVRNGALLTAYVKGASELILASSTQYVNESGQPLPITAEVRASLEAVIDDMARQGNRTIGVAYVELPKDNDEAAAFPEEEPDLPLIFLGVLGIQDPIREEVPRAIRSCNRAGIVVRMVTGDNIKTAIAIAKKCGLYTEGQDVALQGPDFRELHQTNPEALRALLPRLRVLARSSPTDKQILVGELMALGDVVGVTGDGTNDAAALKLANVGFAMQSGTEVAKGASAMVLMDDNFATVVRAVMWGRAVNDNVRKFMQYQLTINCAGAILTFIGSAVSEDNKEPLSAVQLLWLNLIMDTIAALSLATEKCSEGSLDRPPVFRHAPLISRRMWSFIFGHATFQLAVMFVLVYFGHVVFRANDADCEGEMHDGWCYEGLEHRTCLFNTFVLMQVFNSLNARQLYGGHNILDGMWSRSRPMVYLLVVTVLFQVFAVMVAGKFMETTPIDARQWGICIGLAAPELIVGFFVRLIPVKEKTSNKTAPAPEPEALEKANEVLSRHKSLAAIADYKIAFRHGDPSLSAAPHTSSHSLRSNPRPI
eukprot:TRINITY_DN254_c0_g3_i2.p1 TRINITY_DN254_c0_g3~~TRINITY_DN254_c0_g3_i2.p1  ORF type:complete len:1281 (+),score=280.83 TRINITY_DN254_c0_g3_i2:38-3880(+)